MSALAIKPRKGTPPTRTSLCEGYRGHKRCQSSGRYIALIMGRPAAYLCATCRRGWESTWTAALDGFEEAA